MRSLDEYLPIFEFSERHEVSIAGTPDEVDRALREVSIGEIPIAHALLWLRGLGRRREEVHRPFLGHWLRDAVHLEDVGGEGVVLGLTGQFWKLRGEPDSGRPRTRDDFRAYDRPDACKAVVDLRIAGAADGRCRLSTETRVHVPDPEARRSFRRYWRVVRPFSGLIRILLLRAVRRRVERRG
jgi:hypothetical protein